MWGSCKCNNVLNLCKLNILRICFSAMSCNQSSHAAWNVLESLWFFCKISRHWKVLENDFCPGESWKFKLKVLESSGICWDAEAIMQTLTQKYSHGICTPLVLMICSYSDKTYFFTTCDSDEWTLQYGCYCCAVICRVSNCCLCLYLLIAVDYKMVLKDTFGALESSGKVLDFILGKTVGTLSTLEWTMKYWMNTKKLVAFWRQGKHSVFAVFPLVMFNCLW